MSGGVNSIDIVDVLDGATLNGGSINVTTVPAGRANLTSAIQAGDTTTMTITRNGATTDLLDIVVTYTA